MKTIDILKSHIIITVVCIGFNCGSNEVSSKSLDMSFKSNAIKWLNGVTNQRRQADAVSPRFIFDFLTDPSLVVTILHTLEVAYWTLPLGFLLMPIINFFRVPNRRNGRFNRKLGQKEKQDFEQIIQKFYEILKKSVKNFEKLDENNLNGFTSHRHSLKN